ncbi:hypothetical protein EIZ92_09400 [Escherichia coli]|nr:hypothetical protein [Escherichia coli]
MVRRLRFSGPKTSIICSPMTSLKTSIKTITYLSDIGCLEIQGASLRCTNPRGRMFLHMLVEKPPHFARSVRYTVARDKIFCCCMLHTLHYTKSGLFNQ